MLAPPRMRVDFPTVSTFKTVHTLKAKNPFSIRLVLASVLDRLKGIVTIPWPCRHLENGRGWNIRGGGQLGGKYTNAGWVDFRVARGYARRSFNLYENGTLSSSPCLPISRECARPVESGSSLFHRRVDNRVRLLDGQFEIDIFRARSLSIFFFTSFFLSLRLSSSYLEINEKKREREGGRRILKIGEHTFGYSNWKDKNFIQSGRGIIEGTMVH